MRSSVSNKNSDPIKSPTTNKVSIQARLEVGAVNDPLEKEADNMVDRVIRMPENGLIQRK